MSVMDRVEKTVRARTNADKDKEPVLSLRETDVLRLLAIGLTKAEIGGKLNISTHTVDFHTWSILSKLGVRNVAAAIYFSTSRGLIPLA